jgi:hypothetical protein
MELPHFSRAPILECAPARFSHFRDLPDEREVAMSRIGAAGLGSGAFCLAFFSRLGTRNAG